jgi:hypothetical protein
VLSVKIKTQTKEGQIIRSCRFVTKPKRKGRARATTDQICDRIPLRSDVIEHDVCHLVRADLGGEVDGDLDSAVDVLFFESGQERAEPFGRGEVPDDPGEVASRRGKGRGEGLVRKQVARKRRGREEARARRALHFR